MRAATIQFEPGAHRTENIAAAATLIDHAVTRDRATLVSLPEMWTCLGGDRGIKLAQAEVLPVVGAPVSSETAPATAFLRDMARRHGIIVHGGSVGERDGDRLFNTSLVFGPDGAELARYRKIHLFDVTTPTGQGYRESVLFGSGDRVVAVAAGGTTFGLSICYDLRFPELYAELRRLDAAVIFVPAAFTAETGRDHWEVLLRARAIETQAWIIAAATTGAHRDARGQARATWGHSMIIDPWGAVRASLAEAPGVACVDVDLALVTRVRAQMPVLSHRRLGIGGANVIHG